MLRCTGPLNFNLLQISDGGLGGWGCGCVLALAVLQTVPLSVNQAMFLDLAFIKHYILFSYIISRAVHDADLPDIEYMRRSSFVAPRRL